MCVSSASYTIEISKLILIDKGRRTPIASRAPDSYFFFVPLEGAIDRIRRLTGVKWDGENIYCWIQGGLS